MFRSLLAVCLLPLFAFAEQTITLIKPNGVSHKHIGDVLHRYENEDFAIKNLKMVTLTKSQAEEFYDEHKSKPFFEELTTYMSSGPIVVILLDGNDAVYRNRKLIGDTNPQNAAPGTLRALYGQSKARNSIHGSDSAEAAAREADFFFKQN